MKTLEKQLNQLDRDQYGRLVNQNQLLDQASQDEKKRR
jgi:hypothetical protein